LLGDLQSQIEEAQFPGDIVGRDVVKRLRQKMILVENKSMTDFQLRCGWLIIFYLFNPKTIITHISEQMRAIMFDLLNVFEKAVTNSDH
jgi:hypothetical protein